MDNNMVGWFEIPVTNMNRAIDFYNSVFKIDVQPQDFGGTLMGWFPFDEGKPGAAGSLIQNEAYEPSDKKGTLVYFNSEDVNNELNRVEGAGGKVIQAKTQISPDIGYMAIFIDSEGNRIALHSRT
ncbi:VOC family protein [Flavivirga amylovorans]|uniref:VOC family protein n=1 Tax=Flavivirga amylovorans TaxID=870486 RepID=A0ABT8X819_9FLAO|nr:VOC family protein [Flavivirga amylovorans]MDO5989710.1 VOC family protein [Flavivirga amylovorans]